MYYIKKVKDMYWVQNPHCPEPNYPCETKREAEQKCNYLNGGLHPTTQKALATLLNAGLREIENK